MFLRHNKCTENTQNIRRFSEPTLGPGHGYFYKKKIIDKSDMHPQLKATGLQDARFKLQKQDAHQINNLITKIITRYFAY